MKLTKGQRECIGLMRQNGVMVTAARYKPTANLAKAGLASWEWGPWEKKVYRLTESASAVPWDDKYDRVRQP